MIKENKAIGYLPDERPPAWKLFLYALQQVVVMFPATILVALITGFHMSTTIFASGLATICFILITGRKIPLYYGSSFSYLSAISGMLMDRDIPHQFGEILPDNIIQEIQFGIIFSGLISIAAGLIIKYFGKNIIDKILPATVTGPVAMIIGLSLAGNALSDAAPDASQTGIVASDWVWLVSIITLVATILFSVYLKGVWGQLPLLLGPAVGCAVAVILLLIGEGDMFRSVPAGAAQSGIFAVPNITFPKVSWAAVGALMPIALATIPESTAHVYQLDIYVNDLARKKGKKEYDIGKRLGQNLIGDGIGDMISGAVGGPAGTNYGENISAMAITKVFSVPVLIAASVLAMIISFFTPLMNAIYGIPQAVIGGMEIYLFGAIAAQGIAIMIDKKADMFDSRNIAVIAVIMILGVGGQYAFGGMIPFLGAKIPCIAAAAIVGIILNLCLSIGRKTGNQPAADEPQE